MEFILASNSPRRKEILTSAGFKFKVVSADFEEKAFSTDPVTTAKAFALGKANATFNLLKGDALVLGADTVVFLDGEILGKPKDESCARAMLKRLSGRTHVVVTGYALIYNGGVINDSVTTEVTFNDLSDELIESYLSSGLYKGKAGSYGIQDPFPLVKSYNGSLTNVIGLPIEVVAPIIKDIIANR